MRRLLGNTDIFNPVSQQILLAAGKLAGMNVGKTLLDLGCGKGFPSLLWASQFGVRVQGYDINESYVEYANALTKLLGLEEQVQYFCQDLQTFHCTAKSDVVASLGIELSWLGGRIQALNRFKEMLNPDSTLILAEPVWRQKPVSPQVLKELGVLEDNFLTLPEMQHVFYEKRFEELGCFISSKGDRELYVRPIFVTMQALTKRRPELTNEAQTVINSFRVEKESAGKYWDVALWVIKPV